MKHYTDKTWPGDMEADGEDVAVTVALGVAHRVYCMRGQMRGSITVYGAGNGDARRDGDGAGNAGRDGKGYGSAHRTGDGDGDVWRIGAGDGDARRSDAGSGAAWRSGDGDGSAHRTGAGDGNAWRTGEGNGEACHNSGGDGFEKDKHGIRRRITAPCEIGYLCAYGDGHLRIGCEIHTLADWIAHADAIDAKHEKGIAALTRALALKLQQKEETQ